MKTCLNCGNIITYQRGQYCSFDCGKDYEKKLDGLYKANTERLAEIINPIPHQTSNYIVDVDIRRLEFVLDGYREDYGLIENPDFQRGHVWTRAQQIAYMEAMARGCLGDSQKLITLNCPIFKDDRIQPVDMGQEMVIVDGLQRATAIIKFMNGEFKLFDDRLAFEDFNVSAFSLKRATIRVQILSYYKKIDLLRYYVAINSGGVVHSDAEIKRVKQMIEELK